VCFHDDDDDDGDDVRKRLQVRTRTLLWLQVETAGPPHTPPRESPFPPRRVTPHATFNGRRLSRHLAIDARQTSMHMHARSRWVCMYQHRPFKLTQWPRTSRATSLISRMHIAGPIMNRACVPESQRATSVYPTSVGTANSLCSIVRSLLPLPHIHPCKEKSVHTRQPKEKNTQPVNHYERNSEPGKRK
jgi:hypothetical protein